MIIKLVHLRSWQQFTRQFEHELKPFARIIVSIINELHHCGRYDETSASSARQPRKFISRWLRENGRATAQLCEGMLQENVYIFVYVCAF
jgi:hypothetical protein